MLASGEEKVLVELKRARFSKQMLFHGVAQLEHYMMISKIRSGILYSYPNEACALQREERPVPNDGGKIIILSPKLDSPSTP